MTVVVRGEEEGGEVLLLLIVSIDIESDTLVLRSSYRLLPLFGG